MAGQFSLFIPKECAQSAAPPVFPPAATTRDFLVQWRLGASLQTQTTVDPSTAFCDDNPPDKAGLDGVICMTLEM
jgi:hypothetical protein